MSYEGKMKKNLNFWCLRKCTCLYYFYFKKIAKVILAHFSKIAYCLILFMGRIVIININVYYARREANGYVVAWLSSRSKPR